jgi:hypothetical protein
MTPTNILLHRRYWLQSSYVTSADDRLTHSHCAAALLELRRYALTRPHSRQWLAAIDLLLGRERVCG